MEKLIYLLWRSPETEVPDFQGQLLKQLAPELMRENIHGLRINLPDSHVAAQAPFARTILSPAPSAFVQLWLDSAQRAEQLRCERLFQQYAQAFRGYVVTESLTMPNRRHPPVPGRPTGGIAQITLIRKPEGMDRAEWLDLAHQPAVLQFPSELTSAFEVVHNSVLRPLRRSPPFIDLIWELCVPEAAIQDMNLFFKAPGNPVGAREHFKQMTDRISAVVAPGSADVIPTRQYHFRSVTWQR